MRLIKFEYLTQLRPAEFTAYVRLIKNNETFSIDYKARKDGPGTLRCP
jgi:hypothetical protein